MTDTIPISKLRGPNPRRPAISILGSTGSIGKQTLEVADSLGLRVEALSADINIKLLEEQTRKFKPTVVAVFNEGAARDFRARVRDIDVSVYSGMEGLFAAACVPEADTVVAAMAGTIGLLPTIAAIELGRVIALANKETLVCAGEHVMMFAEASGALILPLDSEHSAIMQCIMGGGTPGDVKGIVLTASGGPFRGFSREKLSKVTPKMALQHPTWSMGKKVTIDSATLMNKGFEVIEAVHLFGYPPEMISVVVHPQSIIHSMVEFNDNSIMAQLASPDMRLPIQKALTFFDCVPSLAPRLDIARMGTLTFEEPDLEAFPCLELALETAGIRGTACAVLNGANEAAVDLFLQGKLGFYGIYDKVIAALEDIANIPDPSLEDIIEAGEEGKQRVYREY